MKTSVETADEIVGGPGLSKKDAEILSALITSIQRELGHLTTKELLEAVISRSRPKKSPTHHLFEWDPVKGHAIYLIERARQLIMRVRVIFAEAPKSPVRAFPIVTTNGKKGPIPMHRALDNRDMMASLLEEAKADLERWTRRYEQLRDLTELRGVFAAVSKATKKRKVA